MKLSQFTIAGRNRLEDRLAREKENWDCLTYWRNSEDAGHLQMKAWHDAFQKFRTAVLADADIPAAFREWSGLDIGKPDMMAINVPQLQFHDDYKLAVRELAISQQFFTT